MSELQAAEPTPDAAGGSGASGDSAGAALAALGYSTLLLICWLFSAELLQALLGDRPRLVLVGAQIIGLLLPAIVLTRLFAGMGLPTTTSRGAPPRPASLAVALVGLVVSGYLVALSLNVAWLELLKSTGWAWVGEAEEIIAEAYGELLIADSGMELVGILLMVSLVPAVCEELAFRRGLQGLLASRLSAPAAVLTTALIFSAFHLEPFGLPTRFFLGISLGIVYHRTGSLWAAGLLHAAHNLAAVISIQIADANRGEGPPSLSELEGVPLGPIAVIGALGLVGWVVSVQLLRSPEAPIAGEVEA